MENHSESFVKHHDFRITIVPDPSYTPSGGPKDRGQLYCYETRDSGGNIIDTRCGYCADEVDIAILQAQSYINYMLEHKVLPVYDVVRSSVQNAVNILEGAKVMHYYAQLPEEGLALLQEVEDELRRALPQS